LFEEGDDDDEDDVDLNLFLVSLVLFCLFLERQTQTRIDTTIINKINNDPLIAISKFVLYFKKKKN
jgi:hypothetical protein